MYCSLSDLSLVEKCLQSDLDDVIHWLCSSRLCLNIVKSHLMLIGSCQRIANKMLKVSVECTLLTQVSSVHYLGATFDPMLSWNLHVFFSNVVCRVYS